MLTSSSEFIHQSFQLKTLAHCIQKFVDDSSGLGFEWLVCDLTDEYH